MIRTALKAFLAACFALGLTLQLQASQEEQPAGSQLPQELRGAKIYQLPDKMKPGETAENPVLYRRLEYHDINLERLVLDLYLSVKPVDREATIRRIHFQDFKVSGLPVHIEPFEEEFRLSKKETIDLPAPLKCSIVFADLSSVAPLKKIIDRDALEITGKSFIEVQLSALQKVALWARRLVIPVDVSEEVPLEMFSGNPLLQMAASRILDTLADPTTEAAVALARQHVAQLAAEQALSTLGRESLYLLVCEYSLRDPATGVSERFSQSGTAFAVSADGRLLTAKRVIQPWKFDPQIALLMKRHKLKLDEAAYRLSAWGAGARFLASDGQLDLEAGFSTENETLDIVRTAPDRMKKVDCRDPDSGEGATLRLHEAGENDVALLHLKSDGLKPLVLAEPGMRATPELRTALIGFPFALSQALADPKPTYLSATTEGPWIKLERSVNPGESGAPLVTPDGKVLAMSGGANECIPVEVLRKLLQ